jgi:hypothetical protein
MGEMENPRAAPSRNDRGRNSTTWILILANRARRTRPGDLNVHMMAGSAGGHRPYGLANAPGFRRRASGPRDGFENGEPPVSTSEPVQRTHPVDRERG